MMASAEFCQRKHDGKCFARVQ